MKDWLLRHKKKIAGTIVALMIALGAMSEGGHETVMMLVDMLPDASEIAPVVSGQ